MIHDTSPITLKRLRAYATLIAVCIWTILAVDFSVEGPIDRLGKVKGTDFLHFYVTGSLARDGRWDQLYDVRTQYARAQAVAPASPDTLFIPIESPQTALLMAPLAAHHYEIALAVWLVISVLLYAGSCAVMWRDCRALRDHRYLAIASSVAFPGLYSVVLHGQLSSVGLACVAAALFALRRGWRFAAGLALGLLVFKPHWVAAAAAVFLAAREWRVVAGTLVCAAGQLGATFVMVGSRVMAAYWQALRSLPRIAAFLEPRPSDSLRGLFKLLMPSEASAVALYSMAAIATIVLASGIWRSRAPIEVRHSAAVLALVLISPHVGAYDLVLLGPVYFLLSNWLARSADTPHRTALAGLLCASFIAPICGGLPAIFRMQLTVGTMATLLLLLRHSVNDRGLVGASARTAAV